MQIVTHEIAKPESVSYVWETEAGESSLLSSFLTADDATATGLQVPEAPSGSSTLEISLPRQRNSWQRNDENRFDLLVRKAARRTITAEEMRELETLERDRNAILCPRSAEQIATEFERSQVTDGLIAALEKYVVFMRKGQKAAQSR